MADAALFAQDRMLTPLREPTAADIAAWLHAHPDGVAAVLGQALVGERWVQSYRVWTRSQIGDLPEDYLVSVVEDEETDRWVVELRDVEHDDDYATAAEAMAAADKALVEDGYALVGGVPDAG